jgi:hypothetical protein
MSSHHTAAPSRKPARLPSYCDHGYDDHAHDGTATTQFEEFEESEGTSAV